MRVYYNCPTHGKFQVQHTAGGESPGAAVCPVCDQPSPRVHRQKFGFTVPPDMYDRIKEYCRTKHVSISKFFAELTKDPDALQRATDRAKDSRR